MKPRRTTWVYGLTGGIGSGKSVVARMIAERGIPVFDADECSRQATRPGGEAYAAVVAAFGGSQGEPDRAALARRVFADPEDRRRLEAIVHPIVERALLRWIDAQGAGAEQRPCAMRTARSTRRMAPLCFYVAPLLFEAGHDRLVDGVVVIACDEETRVRRVVERDGAEPADVRARIRAQMTDGERVARATHVLSNDATIDDLSRRVDSLLAALELRQAAGAPA